MALIVQKYGGSSLAGPKHIQRAARRIAETKAQGYGVVVVVSAMGRMTDHLIRVAHRVSPHPRQRELDMLMTAGERVSMSLLAMALEDLGVAAISFTGSQSGIVTTSDHNEARILEIKAHRIEEELQKGKVAIVAGFQGVSREKEITTLGRGGSDTTAVAMAAVLKAERCEILTDVDGLFTADPRRVPKARLISQCTYEEALELASLGAKMHPRSLTLAKKFEVNLRITSSFTTGNLGTQVKSHGGLMESPHLRGIASKEGYGLFRVKPAGKPIFSALKDLNVSVRHFQSNPQEVLLLIDKEKCERVSDKFKQNEIPFERIDDVALLSLVGEGVSQCSEILPEFWQTLQDKGSSIFMISSNSMSVSAVVKKSELNPLAETLHSKFTSLGFLK